jgi:hypothetical protein
MPNYSLILLTNYSQEQWSITENDYSTLLWLSSSQKPTQEELDAQWDVVVEKVAASAYKNKRAAEYPSIVDQLDYIYHNGIDAWKTDMIDPVKNKYPKS